MFKIFIAFFIIFVAFASGMVAQIYYRDIMERTKAYDTIMLTIPKNDKELQKQYLAAYAQVTMLEQMMMWNTKKQIISKGEKK